MNRKGVNSTKGQTIINSSLPSERTYVCINRRSIYNGNKNDYLLNPSQTKLVKIQQRATSRKKIMENKEIEKFDLSAYARNFFYSNNNMKDVGNLKNKSNTTKINASQMYNTQKEKKYQSPNKYIIIKELSMSMSSTSSNKMLIKSNSCVDYNIIKNNWKTIQPFKKKMNISKNSTRSTLSICSNSSGKK